jgi:hypothetical protein
VEDAETGEAGLADGGTVEVPVRLEISGGVPGWQTFFADTADRGQAVDAGFCSSDPANTDGGAWAACEPGVYRGTVEVPAGVPTEVQFVRQDSGSGTEEVFYSETVTATAGISLAASYEFPDGSVGGADEGVTSGGGVFRLVLDGEAPGGKLFLLRDVAGVLGADPEAPVCSTAGENPLFPACRDNGGSNDVPFVWPVGAGGQSFAYEVVMVDVATGEETVIASGSRPMVEGAVIEARHAFGGAPEGPTAPVAASPGAAAPEAAVPGGETPETVNVSFGSLPVRAGETGDAQGGAGRASTVADGPGVVAGARALPETGGGLLLSMVAGTVLAAGGIAARRLSR